MAPINWYSLSLKFFYSPILKQFLTYSSLNFQITGTALVLDEIINHVQSLQRQVEVRLMHPIMSVILFASLFDYAVMSKAF